MLVYNKAKINPTALTSYEDLAKPEFKGQVCTRSGTHPYMLSWIGAMTENLGREKAQNWARGVVANFARTPRGGDTDQIKAVGTSECGIGVTNSYYLARILRSSKPEDRQLAEKVGFIFPNQTSVGAHVNVSGAGITRHAKNEKGALRLLEWLSSDKAQNLYADVNMEYPVNLKVKTDPVVAKWGDFKHNYINVAKAGELQAEAVKLMDRAGYR